MEKDLKNFINKLVKLGDWGVITQFFNEFEPKFIEKHWGAICWDQVVSNLDKFKVPDWVWEKYGNIFDWNKVSANKLSEDFIEKYKDKLNWREVLQANEFSEDFIRRYLKYMDGGLLVATQHLSEEFLWEFRDFIDWEYLWQDVSNDFLRKATNYIHWNSYIWRKRLTEELLREFRDYLDWTVISHTQTLSEPFIKENWDKINFDYLILSNYCCFSKEFVKEMVREKINDYHLRLYEDELKQKYGWEFYRELVKIKDECKNRRYI